MPFLAVVIMMMIAVAAVTAGMLFVFRDRLNVRDAADAAVWAAVNTGAAESFSTFFGEEYWEERNQKGRIIDWGYRPVEKDKESRIVINDGDAKNNARKYFIRNLGGDGMNGVQILDWELQLKPEQRMLDIRENFNVQR